MNNNNNQGVSLLNYLNQDILGDFELLSDSLFDVCLQDLGFVGVSLFMHEEKTKRLIFVKGKNRLQQSSNLMGIDNDICDDSLLDQSFKNKEVLMTNSSEEIFETDPIDDNQGSQTFVLLPITMFETSIGVFLLSSDDDFVFTNSEKGFLERFSEQIGIHLYTAWSLKNSVDQTAVFRQAKNEYEDLINIKREYLYQMQKMLVGLLQKSSLNDENKVKVAESLKYLNSVMLLSESTVDKHAK